MAMNKQKEMAKDIKELFDIANKDCNFRNSDVFPIALNFYEGKYEMHNICLYYRQCDWGARQNKMTVVYYEDEDFHLLQSIPGKVFMHQFNSYDIQCFCNDLSLAFGHSRNYYINKFVAFLKRNLAAPELENWIVTETNSEIKIKVGERYSQTLFLDKDGRECINPTWVI